MSTVTNEVLAAKIDVSLTRLDKLELKIDGLDNKYVGHDIFNLRLKEVDAQIKALDIKLLQMARQKWVQNTLSAVFGAILTGVVGAIIYAIFNKR